MKVIIRLWIFLFITFFGFAQHPELDGLFVEAGEKLYYIPVESAKIAEYISQQNNEETITAEALFILGRSQYLRGNYRESVQSIL